ncbi:DUF1643 domain-containing protein [Terrabacter terrigena]|uniref:DUF1643 domain-containing protein n=1 Tax=Terrabacter terrigena TaxID=574718 RepID=A0ABW3MXN9_9MICO
MSNGFTDYAEISEDGHYRYMLGRRWDNGPLVRFVMLNPSTADATTDDPTIRRCIGFAKAWGFAGLHVVNLYAYRATNPRELWAVDDPVGPENDAWLADEAAWAKSHDLPLIAAWGVHAEPRHVAYVRTFPGFDRLQALGTTKDGHPRHPLYLRRDAQLEPWRPS